MVDAETELPMPWCDAKWRYDAGGEASEVGSYKPSHENEVLTLISYEPEPEAEEEVGLVPSAARKSLPKDARVRAIPRGRLQYVVFDILVSNSAPCHAKGCAERFRILETLMRRLRKHSPHVRLTKSTAGVRTREQLQVPH